MEYTLLVEGPVSKETIQQTVKDWLRDSYQKPSSSQRNLGVDLTKRNSRAGLTLMGKYNYRNGPVPTWPPPAPPRPVKSSSPAVTLVPPPASNPFSNHQIKTKGYYALSPHIKLSYRSEMGREQVHTFALTNREILVLRQGGLHPQWIQLAHPWEGPMTLAAVQAANGPAHPSAQTDWERLKLAMQSGVRQLPATIQANLMALLNSLLTLDGFLMIVALTAVFVLGGEVALLILGAVAVYDLLMHVLPLLVDFYHKAIAARSQIEVEAAGKLFAQALLRGGLDVIDVLFAAGAYRRLLTLGGGVVSFRGVMAYLAERVRLLQARLASGSQGLKRLTQQTEEWSRQKIGKKTLLPIELQKYAGQGLDEARLKAAYDAAPDKAKFIDDLKKDNTIFARQERIRDFDAIPGVAKGADPANGLSKTDIRYIGPKGVHHPELDLPASEAVNFSKAKPVQLKEGDKIYRVVGGSARDTGGYWVTEKNLPKGYQDVIGGTAVKPSWGNEMTEVIEYTVPKEGMVVWEGPAASQPIGTPPSTTHHLPGGDNQIFVPNVYRDYKRTEVLNAFKGNITKRTPIKWKK